MTSPSRFASALIATIICLLSPISNPHSSVAAEISVKTFRGTKYQVVKAVPEEIQLHWKDKDGKAIKRLTNLRELLRTQGRTVDMVMNAGIYSKSFTPEGLHVEEGKTMVDLNAAEGEGNFYLLPNGIFLIDRKYRPHVMSTLDYRKRNPTPRLATQSGPLLLKAGKIHPKFSSKSTSKKIRNGVGVDKDGSVWFAAVILSPGNVTNFFNFAEFFASLGCDNALYLDGTISQMIVSDKEVGPQRVDFVGILSVSRKKE